MQWAHSHSVSLPVFFPEKLECTRVVCAQKSVNPANQFWAKTQRNIGLTLQAFRMNVMEHCVDQLLVKFPGYIIQKAAGRSNVFGFMNHRIFRILVRKSGR